MQTKLLEQSKSEYLLPRINAFRSVQKSKANDSIEKKSLKKSHLKLSKSNSQISKSQKTATKLQNSRISSILKTVRTDYQSSAKKISELGIVKLANHNKTLKKSQQTKRLQKKVITPNNFYTPEKNNHRQTQAIEEVTSHFNEEPDKKLALKEIIFQNKPPQRYSNFFQTQMVAYQSSLILFGGIGCEKNLTWAKMSFNPQNLLLPQRQLQKNINATNTPFYGHTMTQYKHNGYIYGGVNADILHELFILNLKTMQITSGKYAPYRRKYHASTMIGKFMLVYGGIQENETKNNMFYYDTQYNQWATINNTNLPYLSHHSMVVMNGKNIRKIGDIFESNQILYVFGGKDQKGQCSNKLYKIKFVEENHQIQCEEVILSEFSDPVPEKRFNCCFQALEYGNILLYGGKNDTQQTDFDKKCGTFRDVYIFNTAIKAWKKHELDVDYRHSMASTSMKGKVYIYGGLGDRFYANANILMIKMSQKFDLHSAKQVHEFNQKEIIP